MVVRNRQLQGCTDSIHHDDAWVRPMCQVICASKLGTCTMKLILTLLKLKTLASACLSLCVSAHVLMLMTFVRNLATTFNACRFSRP